MGDARGNYISKTFISGNQVGNDLPAVFANSALINTQVIIDIPKPANTIVNYMLDVYNPSTVTDLTIKIFKKELAFGGDTRYPLLTTISIPKSQTLTGTLIDANSKLLTGIFAGADCRIVVSNDTALGAAEGFAASIRLREV